MAFLGFWKIRQWIFAGPACSILLALLVLARESGRGARIRTGGLQYPKLARYQTALRPALPAVPEPCVRALHIHEARNGNKARTNSDPGRERPPGRRHARRAWRRSRH